MKKTIATTLLMSCLSASVMASSYLGIEFNSAHSKIKDYSGTSKGTGVSVIAGAEDTLNNNVWLALEAKYKFKSGVKFVGEDLGYRVEIKEKSQLTGDFLLGYNISDVVIPYAKVGYAFAKYDVKAQNWIYNVTGDDSANGFQYGAGVKFLAGKHFIIGLDYTRQNLKSGDIKFVNNQVGLNASFRF